MHAYGIGMAWPVANLLKLTRLGFAWMDLWQGGKLPEESAVQCKLKGGEPWSPSPANLLLRAPLQIK